LIRRIRSNLNKSTASSGEAIKKIARQEGTSFASEEIGRSYARHYAIVAAIALSPCDCRGNQGKVRWSVKNDSSVPPADASAIQAVTPSDIFSWPRLDVRLTQSSERTGIENNWFALTGRVVALKVETDGD